MKRLQFLPLLVLLFVTTLVQAQDDMPTYKAKVTEANKLYKEGKYAESAKAFSEGFGALGKKAYPKDRYNAACSFALAGETDSALYHLYRLADGKSKYSNLSHITADQDLNSLHEEKRWGEIIALVKKNKEEKEKNYNHELIKQLDSIYEKDQGIRRRYQEMTSTYKKGSEELEAYWAEMNKIDRENEAEVIQILDEYGWLGSDVVGGKGNTTLFLVIQHAPLETQQKYLPMMRQAVKDGAARGSSLALLEDRVNLRTGKKQIYGSQIGTDEDGNKYVQALEDPMNVDERRASVGLGPLNDYTMRWGFTFDPVEYLKNIKKYEALLEKR